MNPSPELLRELLAYDPGTGALTWKPRPVEMFADGKYGAARNAAVWNSRYAGKPAFAGVNSCGYWKGCIFGRQHLAHRVAWAIHYGEWPEEQIDHINGDRADNRAVNLRDVTHADNQRNTKRRAVNTSGATGVFWNKAAGKWQAQITALGHHRHLGTFADFEAAVAVRKAAEREHGFHENHGRCA